MSSDKNERNIEWRDKLSDSDNGIVCCGSMKWSTAMTTIYTDILLP